jgi:hypothetical protein
MAKPVGKNYHILKSPIRWAKTHPFGAALVVAVIGAFLLWILRGSINYWLPVLVNVAILVLATYTSLGPVKKRITKTTIWVAVVLITVGNFYLYRREQATEKLYLDILAPNIPAIKALDLAKVGLKGDLRRWELIDIVGSYYICLKKPDTFFYQFPEWVFFFRSPKRNEILEIRVCDGRMPVLPSYQIEDMKHLGDGQIAMHMKFKVSLAYLGISQAIANGTRDVVVILDRYGRCVVAMFFGQGQPYDGIAEVVESGNSIVFARVRSVGLATDNCTEYTVIESPVRIGKTIVSNAYYPASDFYKSLDPITDWRIDAEKAIALATANGARAIPPDKIGQAGGPGIFRLYNTWQRNLRGAYWQIPYRVGIRPILVDAKTGEVYAVNDSGEYSRKW